MSSALDGHHAHHHGAGGHSHGLVHDSIKRSREGLRAVALALLVLALTAAAQTLVFIASGSVALLADLVHNAGDAATAIPLGIAFALRSARGERLAGLAVVAVIFISACVAGYEAIARLIDPAADRSPHGACARGRDRVRGELDRRAHPHPRRTAAGQPRARRRRRPRPRGRLRQPRRHCLRLRGGDRRGCRRPADRPRDHDRDPAHHLAVVADRARRIRGVAALLYPQGVCNCPAHENTQLHPPLRRDGHRDARGNGRPRRCRWQRWLLTRPRSTCSAWRSR